MTRITYHDLVSRFGDDKAKDMLQAVESLAEINSQLVRLGEEDRLQTALEALNSITFSA